MAICQCCKNEMCTGDGCCEKAVKYEGSIISRLKVTKDEVDGNNRCFDCGAPLNTYHHEGCDIERCPICGEQYISCECDFEELFIDDKRNDTN